MGLNLGEPKLSFLFAKLVLAKRRWGRNPCSHVKATKGAEKQLHNGLELQLS